MPLKSYDKDAFHLYTNIWFSLLQTHSEVHEVEELFQHFCHDGEISFWQVVPHSSHIQLVDKDAVRKREREVHKIIKIRNQKTEHPIKMLSWYVLCVCVCVTHRAPLTQAAQQQCCVGGHDAVLHVLPCMLQSWEEEGDDDDDDEEEQTF